MQSSYQWLDERCKVVERLLVLVPMLWMLDMVFEATSEAVKSVRLAMRIYKGRAVCTRCPNQRRVIHREQS